ncbi:hypothetical protein [Amycolatopsis samaneae]|uniref:Uncharacterized protein n=1 Tax=Amycolatopsis samaneae TaxID=664691 RepID=A0ABW5GD93_9PSEU
MADEKGRCARQYPVAQGAFVVGSCDARGALTVAPKHDFADFTRLCERAGFTVSAAEPLPPETGFWYLEAAPA